MNAELSAAALRQPLAGLVAVPGRSGQRIAAVPILRGSEGSADAVSMT
ncbi:MAG TPA: hypothetical protein VFY32_03705 [Solirubrobacteraceae bacterium]|nr:hypothetical protein [Solirubrobacteraceae bacterium]